ncbi:MAG: hypothetical protein KDD34_02045, partial [Bdellovibrionales bacterium]|nr:hypothetical protein [Bdellovibrionales bacterium]
MNIWYSPYSLNAKSFLNSQMRGKSSEGVLLRVEFSSHLVGYADVHPHPELGDATWEDELKKFIDQKPSQLFTNSLHWALVDAHAREKNEPVIKSSTLPKTHYLCPDIHSFTEEKIQILKQQGYTHIKLKLGRDLDFETKQLKKHF